MTDHSPYIDAVADAITTAGLKVAHYEPLDDEIREAYIELGTLHPEDGTAVIALAWCEDRGWRWGWADTADRSKGIEALTELHGPGGTLYVGVVAPPAVVVAALITAAGLGEVLQARIPDDLESALAAYAPTAAPEPDPRGPRCGIPCPSRAHTCDRDPGHFGFHRDVQQKGTEECSWEESR